MLRFYLTVFVSIPWIIYFLIKARYILKHKDSFPIEERYAFIKRMMIQCMKNGRIRTKYYGTENLPKEGGYVMFPNHQGKFDTLGIMYSHERPCTVVMDEVRSKMPLADEMVDILDGCRLNKSDLRSQVKSIKAVSDEVRAGRIYIIFPEGGYYHNRNRVQEFLPGAFKAAMMAKSPIVPVALVDSYRAFGINILKKITTQVHYLEPLYYEDYKDMKSKEISDYVKLQIMKKINEVMIAKGKKAPNPIVDT